jgi:phospholipid transport system substrate-binding protein
MTRLSSTLILLFCLPLMAPTLGAAEQPTAAVSVQASTAPAPSPAMETPSEVVEKLHSALIGAMRNDELDFEGRYALLEPVVNQTFNLEFMGSKCVGRHWKKLNEQEQQDWLEKFRRLTIANYASRFKKFDGEEFETLGNEAGARETQVVLTKLHIPSDEDVALNYRLMRGEDGWRIIDIYLRGTVSELALRRSEYSATLKRDGFDDLVAAIDRKIEDFRASGS